MKRKLIVFLVIFIWINKISVASLGDFTISDEAKLGKKFYVYITTHFPIVYDPYIVNYIRGVANKLKSVLSPQPFDVTVDVIYNSQINAFAGPGGHVFVNTGILALMDSEAELASVLAHEFAHVTQRHIAASIKRQKLFTIGSLVGVLAGALVGSSVGQAVAVGSVAGVHSAILKYTRKQEREADQVGIQYLVKAGYPPSAMVEAFLKLKKQKILSGENSVPPYFLTHPGIEERISYLEQMQKFFPSKGKTRSNKEFEKIKALVLAHYVDPDLAMDLAHRLKDQCCRRLVKTFVLVKKNKIKEAEQLIRNDYCEKRLEFWYREEGRFYFKLGKMDYALKYLNKAIEINNKDYFALYFRARIYADRQKAKLAIDDLKKILKFVPFDSEIHTILGRIMGRYVSPFYGYIHYAYAALYSGDKDRMNKYLSRAKSLAKSNQEKNALKKFEQEYNKWKKYW